jgi:hypothetical protein
MKNQDDALYISESLTAANLTRSLNTMLTSETVAAATPETTASAASRMAIDLQGLTSVIPQNFVAWLLLGCYLRKAGKVEVVQEGQVLRVNSEDGQFIGAVHIHNNQSLLKEDHILSVSYSLFLPRETVEAISEFQLSQAKTVDVRDNGVVVEESGAALTEAELASAS